jgi:hypothetical protein
MHGGGRGGATVACGADLEACGAHRVGAHVRRAQQAGQVRASKRGLASRRLATSDVVP